LENAFHHDLESTQALRIETRANREMLWCHPRMRGQVCNCRWRQQMERSRVQPRLFGIAPLNPASLLQFLQMMARRSKRPVQVQLQLARRKIRMIAQSLQELLFAVRQCCLLAGGHG
jgi:hypothetical protein